MDEGMRYTKILRESLEKKERLLNNLLDITKQQAEYINSSEFELDVFEELMDVKTEMIEELDGIDEGFQAVYDRIRVYLKAHQTDQKEMIAEMQNRVREITRLSVAIQTQEERNRSRLEVIFSQKKQDINTFRKTSQVVNNYYNSMTGMGSSQSVFFNKKK